jgi:adenosylhomocysteine nucleosidase
MNKIFIIALKSEVENIDNIFGYPILFSGIGKINATIATYNAYNSGYTEIINIGSCGSLNLPISEIVKVGSLYEDIDVTPLSEYGIIPFDDFNNKIIIDNTNIKCFSTDYFYDHNQINKYSDYYKNMINNCDIFDMECFAIAKTCKKLNLTFSSYKWVSDNGKTSDWEKNCKIGFNNFLLNNVF